MSMEFELDFTNALIFEAFGFEEIRGHSVGHSFVVVGALFQMLCVEKVMYVCDVTVTRFKTRMEPRDASDQDNEAFVFQVQPAKFI